MDRFRVWSGRIEHVFGDCFFYLLACLFVMTSLSFFDFVPIWDGYDFVWVCYLDFADKNDLDCFGHVSAFNTLLFGFTQKLVYGDLRLVYALNVALALVAMVAFRAILRHFFGDRLSDIEVTLITFCFLFNPVFLAHVIQPSLDFALPVYLTVLLLALVKRRYYLSGVIGVFIVFTKTNGIMIYGLSMALYLAVKSCFCRDCTESRPRIMESLGLAAPLILFAVYASLFPPHFEWSIPHTWFQLAVSMWYLDLNKVFIAQLLSLFVINFNWIPTIMILLSLFLQIRQGFSNKSIFTTTDGFIRLGEKAYVYLTLVSIVFFNTRFVPWNNPRYMLPILPLFILAFADSIIILAKNRKLRAFALSLIVLLMYLSAFRTFDPVSRLFFGVFKFGSHDILNMSYTSDGGRDPLVYNFEFTKIAVLTEKAINSIGLDRVYVFNRYIPSFLGFNDFCLFDPMSGRRTVVFKESVVVVCLNPDRLAGLNLTEFFFIDYPNIRSAKKIRMIEENYYAADVMVFSEDGYSLSVIHFKRKDYG